MTYLLIGPTRRLRRTRWLTAQHFASARKGDLLIVDLRTGARYAPGGWRDIPPRRGEPLVMILPRDAEEDDDF